MNRLSPPSHPEPARRRARRAAGSVLTAAIAGALAAGCGSPDPNRSGLLEPYRFNLPQGNYLTQEMLDQVKPGMTREQVRFALGSPLLIQTFRSDRWDYVYRFQRANGTADVRKALIRFKDDRVVAVESSALPPRDDPNDTALPGWRPPKTAEGAPAASPAVETAPSPAQARTEARP